MTKPGEFAGGRTADSPLGPSSSQILENTSLVPPLDLCELTTDRSMSPGWLATQLSSAAAAADVKEMPIRISLPTETAAAPPAIVYLRAR